MEITDTTVGMIASHELTHLVREHGQRDLVAVRLSSDQRLGQASHLLRRDLRRHRRREGIDDGLDDDRARCGERLVKYGATLPRILDCESGGATRAGKGGESIGCRSHPYSGLPRKTICYHLIMPSELFFTITILIGSL
jgi:hypothetical protein